VAFNHARAFARPAGGLHRAVPPQLGPAATFWRRVAPGNDLTDRFPLIVEALAFERIRYRHHDASVFLYAFDLIELDGDDLRRDPLAGAVKNPGLTLSKFRPPIFAVSLLASSDKGTVFSPLLRGEGHAADRRRTRRPSVRDSDRRSMHGTPSSTAVRPLSACRLISVRRAMSFTQKHPRWQPRKQCGVRHPYR
jgi:hypothetical protein